MLRLAVLVRTQPLGATVRPDRFQVRISRGLTGTSTFGPPRLARLLAHSSFALPTTALVAPSVLAQTPASKAPCPPAQSPILRLLRQPKVLLPPPPSSRRRQTEPHSSSLFAP